MNITTTARIPRRSDTTCNMIKMCPDIDPHSSVTITPRGMLKPSSNAIHGFKDVRHALLGDLNITCSTISVCGNVNPYSGVTFVS